MRARIIRSLIETGTAARDYIRLVCGRKPSSANLVTDDGISAAAPTILESFRDQTRQRETEFNVSGNQVIKAMDEQLQDYLSPAERFVNWVTRGSYVSVAGDTRRFTVMELWWDRQAVRVQDDEGYDYMIPFSLIGPWPREDEEQGTVGGTDYESKR